MIRYVQMDLVDRKRWFNTNCIASDFEILLYVSKRAVAAVERLLHDRICVQLKGINEPLLGTLSGSLDGVQPKSVAALRPG